MLLVSLLMSQLVYLLLITLVVPYGRTKYIGEYELGAIYYGIIGSMQQVARLSFSVVIGSTMQKVGKKNYIIIGFFLMIISHVGFACLEFLTQKARIPFFILALIFNYILGIGTSCLQIVA
jgi:MFS family permease